MKKMVSSTLLFLVVLLEAVYLDADANRRALIDTERLLLISALVVLVGRGNFLVNVKSC